MRQILEEMDKQMMECFARFGIFLAAIRAITLINDVAAVEARFVLSDLVFRHKKM
jgi:hypothetical protein